MALMKCPDCRREISTSAKECKWCGCSDQVRLDRSREIFNDQLQRTTNDLMKQIKQEQKQKIEEENKEKEIKKQKAQEERKKAKELGISVEEYRKREQGKANLGCVVIIACIVLISIYWDTISQLPIVKSLID